LLAATAGLSPFGSGAVASLSVARAFVGLNPSDVLDLLARPRLLGASSDAERAGPAAREASGAGYAAIVGSTATRYRTRLRPRSMYRHP
jgi:hypothetical protein